MTQPTNSPDELNELDGYHSDLCNHVNHKSAACDCGIQDIKEDIQSSYISKQSVINAIKESEWHDSQAVEGSIMWSQEIGHQKALESVRQSLNLHDNQQNNPDSDTTVGNKRNNS